MTETAGATCPTCATGLPAAGAACPRCTPSASSSLPPGYHRVPPSHPSLPPTPAPGVYAPQPYPSQPYAQQPYIQQPYAQQPYAPQPYAPQPYGAPYPPVAVRPMKSAGIAVLLSFLWIGAGHLYLDRIGTGLVLMGAHFFVGFLLFVLFFPLAFLVWLAAFITCAVVCSNLAHQINAGTVPPRVTW